MLKFELIGALFPVPLLLISGTRDGSEVTNFDEIPDLEVKYN